VLQNTKYCTGYTYPCTCYINSIEIIQKEEIFESISNVVFITTLVIMITMMMTEA